MDTVLFFACLTLALVFLASGVSKLLDPQATEEGAGNLGIAAPYRRPIARILPAVELVLAAALLVPLLTEFAAAASVVLLTGFTVILAVNIARGRKVTCHCFGQTRAGGVIGWRTVIRNGLLILLAVFIATAPKEEEPFTNLGWLSAIANARTTELILLGVLLAALCFLWVLYLQLLGQNGRLLMRVEGIEAGLRPIADTAVKITGLHTGSEAPKFELPRLDGGTSTLADFLQGGLHLFLLFINPGCGPCTALLPLLREWQQNSGPAPRIIIVSRDRQKLKVELLQYPLADVLIQESDEVARAYSVAGTPTAVLIGNDGIIQHPLANGESEIRRLYDLAAGNGDEIRRAFPANSSPTRLPSTMLYSSDGLPLIPRERVDRPALLLFWNSNCGYCRQLAKTLRIWREQHRGNRNFALIAVAPDADTSELTFADDVWIDTTFSLGATFKVPGTPAAVRIGDAGAVESEVLVGASLIMNELHLLIQDANSDCDGSSHNVYEKVGPQSRIAIK